MDTNRREEHHEVCREIHELYKKKNHDYGNSFVNVREEVNRAIIVRLMDKMERLKIITKQDQKVADETIDDTLIDLANYAIMELVERRLERPYEFEPEETPGIDEAAIKIMREQGKII